MSVEKMKILKMLEEGKINAEDAAKLLSMSDTDGTPRASERERAVRQEDAYNGRRNNPSPPSGTAFAEDLGRKFDTFMRDIEPKIRSLSESVVEKTAAAADSISKSLSSSARGTDRNPGTDRNSGYRAPAPPAGDDFEVKVDYNGSELDFTALNGAITLTGYNGDRISAKIRSKAKRRGEKPKVMVLGSKFILSFDEDDYDMVAIEAYIPYNMFKSIRLAAQNGEVSLVGVECGDISVSNSNAFITLDKLRGDTLRVDSQNSKELRLSNLSFRSAEIESSNGAIRSSENDIEALKIVAFNAPVDMSLSCFRNYSDYLWIIETSNKKLNLFIPTAREVGYYIKAATTLGTIRLGLTGMNYIYSDSYNTEAKSVYFDDAPKKVRISLETSNAPLVIN